MSILEDSCGGLQVTNLSAQPGVSRIAWSGDAVLKYKSNLTALSQDQNLYFIALKDLVYVDRPSFPDQHLNNAGSYHDMKWSVHKTSNRATAGFHNRRYPHGVNRLEIDYLGDKEVLACACDDGDIVIYDVSAIQAAFHAIDRGVTQANAVNQYIRPFLRYNVGISTWGIAIQKEARLIATSSNSHKIHVTAVALSSPEDLSSVQDCIPVPEILLPGASEPLDRGSECQWELCGHHTNIPSVSFFLADDRYGSHSIFLLSSDIECNVFIWDITKGSHLTHKISLGQLVGADQYGWIALPLHPSTFRITPSKERLSGFSKNLECLDRSVIVSDDTSRPLQGLDLPFPVFHTRSQQLSLITDTRSKPFVSFISPWRNHERGPPFEGMTGCYRNNHQFSLIQAAWTTVGQANFVTGIFQDYGTLKLARQIPELGIVIAASDAGYAGIFTLTRLSVEVRRFSRTELGVRLDAIVPFDEQVPRGIHELRGLSLWSGLIGIATAPMQGSSRRRFRLILEYSDRTVLCYELSRDNSIIQAL